MLHAMFSNFNLLKTSHLEEPRPQKITPEAESTRCQCNGTLVYRCEIARSDSHRFSSGNTKIIRTTLEAIAQKDHVPQNHENSTLIQHTKASEYSQSNSEKGQSSDYAGSRSAGDDQIGDHAIVNPISKTFYDTKVNKDNDWRKFFESAGITTSSYLPSSDEEYTSTIETSSSGEQDDISEKDGDEQSRDESNEFDQSDSTEILSLNRSDVIVLSDDADPSDVSGVACEIKQGILNNSNMSVGTRSSRCTGKPSICLDLCSYELVGKTAKEMGMIVVNFDSEWDVLWSDPCINQDTHQKMRRYQRANHFPFITELCRKNQLAKNLNLMKNNFPEDYNFFPQTWILPRDNIAVQAYLNTTKGTVIIKPDNGSNGTGITLLRNMKYFHQEPNKIYICQQYISNPFLIDGYKFDFRVYTLITSCNPLRVFAHNDGLARFATVKYEKPMQKNLGIKFMHLTNYSVNKNSHSFINDSEVGSKRRISTLNEWFIRNGYDVERLWARIDDTIVKTILSAKTNLQYMYKSIFTRHDRRTACFQLLGFDILLDENLNPYVLEVNHSPSFHTDTTMDVEIKSKVLHDTFAICNLNSTVKSKVLSEDRIEVQRRLSDLPSIKSSEEILEEEFNLKEEQWVREKYHKGQYRLIYPCNNGDKYHRIIGALQETTYYKETFASLMRTKMGRAQREDKDRKQNNQETNAREQSSRHASNIFYDKKKKSKIAIKNPVVKNIQIKSAVQGKRKKNLTDVTNKVKKTFPKKSITKTLRANPSPKSIPKSISYNPFNMSHAINSKLTNFIVERAEMTVDQKAARELGEAWRERRLMVDNSGIKKMIYMEFKRQNNLSKRDLELYGGMKHNGYSSLTTQSRCCGDTNSTTYA